MRKLLFVFVGMLILSSCVKYAEPKSLSLSGEYVIDKIVYDNRDNDNLDYVYYPGDLYVNPSETLPLDTIEVGLTRIAMDYSTIYMNPVDYANGSTVWTEQYFYFVHGQYSAYDLGYIQFDYQGTRRTWKIVDDGMESLVLRTSGSYDNGANSSGESTTMYLTRVGP